MAVNTLPEVAIAQYIAGIQQYVSDLKGVPVRLVDPSNAVFRPLHQALENRYCQLHTTGVGTK